MDNHKKHRYRLLTLLAAAAALFILQTQCYALDVTLQWDANQESGVSGYVVYYKTGKSGDRIKENYTDRVEVLMDEDENPDPKVVEYTVKGLMDGENYVFAVTAFDGESPRNESRLSNEASTDSVPPSAVSNPTSSHPVYPDGDPCSSSHTVTMFWTEATDPEPGSGLGGYSFVFDGLAATTPDGYRDTGSGVTSVTQSLGDGLHWFHIRAGDKAGQAGAPNWGETAHYGPICIDTGPPAVDWVYLISEGALEIYYSETAMKNAAAAGNYTFDNGGVVSGVTDVTGEGRGFLLELFNFQSYIIYTMRISENVTDAVGNPLAASGRTVPNVNDYDGDGMADDWEMLWFGDPYFSDGTLHSDGDPDGLTDQEKYAKARANPQWGEARWTLSPLHWDSDGDGMSDQYEVACDLNPVDPSDRDLDLDRDGWTNYEESLSGYAANDANSPVPAPPQVKEGIPRGKGPVPGNSVFALRLEATQGIDTTEASGVRVTVDDGTQTYARNLDGVTVKAIPLDPGVTPSRKLWIAYYRSNETAMGNEFSPGATVTVAFEATDVRDDSMTPETLSARIQTAEEEQEETDHLPDTTTLPDTPWPGVTTSGVTDTASALDGAAIIYENTLPGDTGIIPYMGPTEQIPPFDVPGYTGVGVAMNLLPPAVFPGGVTLLIPCPGHTNVSGLYLFYYNGRQWVMACDPAGNVKPGAAGWMAPGSRVNHNGNPAHIEIKVYHFSAVIAATASGTTVRAEGGGGGGCFIDSLMR